MIEIKTYSKPKKTGGSGGSSSSTKYISGVISEAEHAGRADKAKRAEVADQANYAGTAASAQNAAYASEAGNLHADAEILQQYLSLKDTVDPQVVNGMVIFAKGIRFGVQKVADALNEVWDITEAGIAHLSQLFVKGNVQIGEKDKPVEVNFGNYSAGSTGAQVAVKADGTSLAEFDYITIRRAADFRSITIHELRYIGGELAITPAAMQVSKVERLSKDGNVVADDVEPAKFKCYFDTDDSKGEKKVYNEFMVGDQARCQQFGIDAGTHEFVKTKYYWRLVVEVGDDYIVLSNTDKDKLTTSEPSVNDNIVQLGYRYEGQDNRQAAIILSATANDAPSQKFYQGINDYSLDHVVKDEGYDAVTGLFHCNIYGDSYTGDKEGTSFFQYDSKKKEATFKGKMIFNSESKLPDGSSVNDIAKKDDLKDLNIKSGNLLRNTSFCGDYESIDISEDTEISEDKETFSEKLKYWTMENTRVVDTEDSTSGKAVQIGGTLSQQLAQPLLPGKDYVLSFKGKGTTVRVSVGGETQDITMTSSFDRYELHITCSDAANGVFSMVSTNCVVCEIMLSYGTIAPAWSPSYSDNDKSMAEFQNMKFLTDAITQGSTTIDGGLVMSQQFKVGNFRDKKMIKETGGMSGYYNDDDSPFLWGGGTLEQAIYTIQKYKDNTNYEPTAEELNNLAKFVVTHGGRAILTDIILRGIIYAEGGVLQSVRSPNGNFSIDEQGNVVLKGNVTATSGSFGGFKITDKQMHSEGDGYTFDIYKDRLVYADLKNKTTWIVNSTDEDGLKMSLSNEDSSIAMNVTDYGASMTARGGKFHSTFSKNYLGITADFGYTFEFQILSGTGVVRMPLPKAGIKCWVKTDSNYMQLKMAGLPTDGSKCEPGQVYVENGVLKLKS